MSDAVVCIPARLRSTRLPRKVLADILGKTMLERSHDVAVAAGVGPVLVLTDDEEVAGVVHGFGGEAWMTDPDLDSGTARIASVADRLDGDVIVNLQADAPLTDPEVIAQAAREASSSGAPVTMPVYLMTSPEDVHEPSVVKVVRAHDGATLYCSRSAVPHVRAAASEAWPEQAGFWGHVGLYAYTRDFLGGFAGLPPSPLEDAERLEQLRWLQAGLRIHTFEVARQGPSVDTPEQLDRIRGMIAEASTA